jgi:hypothetical protein
LDLDLKRNFEGFGADSCDSGVASASRRVGFWGSGAAPSEVEGGAGPYSKSDLEWLLLSSSGLKELKIRRRLGEGGESSIVGWP